MQVHGNCAVEPCEMEIKMNHAVTIQGAGLPAPQEEQRHLLLLGKKLEAQLEHPETRWRDTVRVPGGVCPRE